MVIFANKYLLATVITLGKPGKYVHTCRKHVEFLVLFKCSMHRAMLVHNVHSICKASHSSSNPCTQQPPFHYIVTTDGYPHHSWDLENYIVP